MTQRTADLRNTGTESVVLHLDQLFPGGHGLTFSALPLDAGATVTVPVTVADEYGWCAAVEAYRRAHPEAAAVFVEWGNMVPPPPAEFVPNPPPPAGPPPPEEIPPPTAPVVL